MSNNLVAAANDPRSTPGRLVPAARSYPALREPNPQVSGGYSAGAEASFAPTLREYWRILNKRKWVVLSVVAAVVALGIVSTLMMTPLYVASVRLQIDRNAAKIVEGGNITPIEGYDFEFMRTQYELMQSRTLAERVASALKLGDNTDFLQAKGFSLLGAIRGLFSSVGTPLLKDAGRADRERAAGAKILANRIVRPVSGSRLVDISYWDADRVRAQRVAAALADAFIASNLDKRFQANADAKTFLDDQLKHLKIRLEESEQTLLTFAQKEQIVAVSEKSSIDETNLASANAALGSLVSERIKNEQLWKQAEFADAMSMPQLLTNRVVETLRDQRNALVAEYHEKLETFKPGYPAMIQLTNKIGEIAARCARRCSS